MNAQDLIQMIKDNGAETDKDVLNTLEDGAALAALGITDEDIEAVEEAHYLLNH